MVQPVITLKIQGANALNALRDNPELLGNVMGGGNGMMGGTPPMGGNLMIRPEGAGGDNGVLVQQLMGGQPAGQGMMVKPVGMKLGAGNGMAIQLGPDAGGQTVILQGVGGRGMDLEGTRIMLTKNGAMIRAGELENGRIIVMSKGAAAKGAAAKGAMAKGAAAKGMVAKATVAKAATVTPLVPAMQQGMMHGPIVASGGHAGGAVAAGKGVGVGLGLGSAGPLILLGAIGLVATGIYLYLKSRHYEDEDFHDDEELAAS